MEKKMKKSMFAVLLLTMLVGASACSGREFVNDTPTRPQTVTDYPLSGFTRLTASGVVHVVLKQGPVANIRVKESSNANMLTKVEKRGDELYIYTKSLKKNLSLKDSEVPVAYVTMPSLTSVDMSGTTHMKMGPFKTGNMNVTVSGASKVQIDELRSDELKLTCSGASKMESGFMSCKSLRSLCSGASNITVSELAGDDVRLMNSGSSKVVLRVDARVMEMTNSGASKSEVKFEGRRLDVRNSGAGKIELNVDCEELSAQNSGAANFVIKGVADKTSIDASGVSKIDTSHLNRF
ncbi:MAG: DUF2807 domain-containing protein [Prevotella sp.]|nr:DUF2807 domain-containing protein [Prevotella sp.]